MNHHLKSGLLALVFAATLALAACGSAGSGGSGDMDHNSMNDGGTTEGTARSAPQAEKTTGASGMDHGSMGTGSSEEMARRMLMENGEYSDERFIDAMVPHHQGAVEMAEVALKNSEHQEIRTLSEKIVAAQRSEIEELKAIKQREFGTSEVPMDMSDEDMRMMGMAMDPQRLAEQRPFDKAFIDNMIPHHRSAIDMANIARRQSDNPRIKELAQKIVDAQEREIEQMETWREEWYPEG